MCYVFIPTFPSSSRSSKNYHHLILSCNILLSKYYNYLLKFPHPATRYLKIANMKNPATVQWHFGLSSHDLKKLTRGFEPTQMEDRWACHADAPDASGHIVVHICRSWSGDEQLRLNVRMSTLADSVPGEASNWAATITDIVWDRSSTGFLTTENEAKDFAVRICRSVLGCELR